MFTRRLEIDTSAQRLTDITMHVATFCRDAGGDGLVNVFVPHATAGLALIERGAGSGVDLEDALERLLPRDERYEHQHGSPGHGADHLLPALLCPSLVLPVEDGRLSLGTWQHIVLVDTNRDNPIRQLHLTLLAA